MRQLSELTWEEFTRLGRVQIDGDCLIWHAARTPAKQDGTEGYGALRTDEEFYAHRIAFRLVNGPIVHGIIRHSCDRRPCVNPQHLLDGTIADNNRDILAHGRKYPSPGPAARAKIAESLRGRALSPAHRAAIGTGNRRAWSEGGVRRVKPRRSRSE